MIPTNDVSTPAARSIDAIANLANMRLLEILESDSASPELQVRAASTMLRYVTAERDRALAREKFRAKNPDAAPSASGAAETIDLTVLNDYQRSILVECHRHLLEHDGPAPDTIDESETEVSDVQPPTRRARATTPHPGAHRQPAEPALPPAGSAPATG